MPDLTEPAPAETRPTEPQSTEGRPPFWRRFVDAATYPGIAIGIGCGLFSAVFYTLSNIALRQSVSVDPFFVAAMKSAPTILILTPYLLTIKLSGRPIVASPHLVPRFMLVCLVGQIGGNVSFQYALKNIGLAASVPITLGSLLIGSALVGRWILGETVQKKTAIAMAILMTAVVLLTQSGEPAAEGVTGDALRWDRITGAIFAMVSGLSFAIFSSMMRLSMQQGLQSATAMWISGAVGTTALFTIFASTAGIGVLENLSSRLWTSIALAGVFNFVAFVAITTAIRVLPIVAVHLLNASQVAMAAIAGVVIFGEPMTVGLLSGIALTMAGLLVMATKKAPEEKQPDLTHEA